MPAIMIFQKETEGLAVSEISETMVEILGLDCCLYTKNAKVPLTDTGQSGTELTHGAIWVNLPDLHEDEGEPKVRVEITPRLDREQPIQDLVGELLEQDPALADHIEHNARDILLTFKDTSAGEEAAYVLAYVLATITAGSILVPGFEEGDETAWFEDPEDFADIIFGEDDGEE